ncbi:MAG: YihY/virulence factor BrkB family protein [Gemmataceae bacterium]
MIISRLRRAAGGWSEDGASQMGAALAYYTLFSLAPLLVLAVALIGVFYGERRAKEELIAEVQKLIDKESADAVRTLLDNFKGSSVTGASAVGLASLLFGATGLFTSLRGSLHRIWRIDERDDGMVWGLVKTYGLALLMVIVSCAFLLLLLLASAFLPLVTEKLKARFPAGPYTGPAVDLGVSVLFLTALFGFTFRILSDRRLTYRQVGLGALVSAVLFALGKIALGYYFATVNLASAYGAAGSVVVFLAWVYYSAQIVFYGAEVVRFGLPGGRVTAAPAPGDAERR